MTFLESSSLLKSAGLDQQVKKLHFEHRRLDFSEVQINSYFASAIVDFLRQKLLAQQRTFTFETVMSHRSKVDLLKQAQAAGYRTYLYYIATEDPVINISRVQKRVQLGGHDVPEDKIKQRYHASLDLLMEAIRHTNRAYVFDNSAEGQELIWLAEITDGRTLEVKTDCIPLWLKQAVLDKIK